MNPPANSFPDRDRLADDTGVALGEEENQRVARKLRAQTVLISKGTGGKEARSVEDMLKSRIGGTGVLVRNGDGPGILTAGHVAGNLVERQRQGRKVRMTIIQGRTLATLGSQGYLPIPLQGEIMSSSEGLGASHKDLTDVQSKIDMHLIRSGYRLDKDHGGRCAQARKIRGHFPQLAANRGNTHRRNA